MLNYLNLKHYNLKNGTKTAQKKKKKTKTFFDNI